MKVVCVKLQEKLHRLFWKRTQRLTVDWKNHVFVIYYKLRKCGNKEENMAVTYKKLFHLLIDRGISTSELTEQAGFSANILTRLRRDQYVSLDSIEKICLALNCSVDDILEFIPDKKRLEEIHMANLSQQKRQRMLEFLQTIREEHKNDDDVLIAIGEIESELNSKKYGLVWE